MWLQGCLRDSTLLSWQANYENLKQFSYFEWIHCLCLFKHLLKVVIDVFTIQKGINLGLGTSLSAAPNATCRWHQVMFPKESCMRLCPPAKQKMQKIIFFAKKCCKESSAALATARSRLSQITKASRESRAIFKSAPQITQFPALAQWCQCWQHFGRRKNGRKLSLWPGSLLESHTSIWENHRIITCSNSKLCLYLSIYSSNISVWRSVKYIQFKALKSTNGLVDAWKDAAEPPNVWLAQHPMQQDVEANQKHCGSGLTMMLPVETKMPVVFGTFLNPKPSSSFHEWDTTELPLNFHWTSTELPLNTTKASQPWCLLAGTSLAAERLWGFWHVPKDVQQSRCRLQ